MEGTVVSLIFISLAILLPVNFLPTIVAHNRKHKNRLAISVLNVFTAFSGIVAVFNPIILLAAFLGWIGGLIWACTSDVEAK